jgi:hypothetical protein
MQRILYFFMLCVAFMVHSLFPGQVDAASQYTVRRFALIVGANDGGAGRAKLKYAVSDAQSFKDVMAEIGGLQSYDTLLLINPDKRNFYSALRSVFSRMRKSMGKQSKSEFFFYYSGHSDEEGILLGTQKIYYKDLKKNIERMPADVRIVILDSCSSGAFARLKGGRKRSPFMIDAANNMKGSAIITSSSIDEASQESDTIKGSFFTHALLTGLRGAADVTQDKKITLNEVYQYAYNETLARTEKTFSGVQHPNYNIQMSGTGDVILTDLRSSTTFLSVSKGNYGKFFVRDADNILVAEFNKPFGSYMTIALAPGKYSVTNQKDGKIYAHDMSLKRGSRYSLLVDHFTIIPAERTALRGNASADQSLSDQTLVRFKELYYGGYGALITKFTRISGTNTVLAGGHAGVILNNRLVLGGGGFGVVYPLLRDEYEPYNGDYPYLVSGYGGGLIEYYFFPGSMYRMSLSLLIGGGTVNFGRNSNDEENSEYEYKDKFFIVEPEVKFFMNVATYIRIGISASYRFVNGVDNETFDDDDFWGPAVSIFIAGGYF